MVAAYGHPMQRRILAVLAAVLVTLGLGSAPAFARSAAAPAASSPGWYLALGDSYATGYQPGVGDDLTGGYVGGVLTAYQQLAPGAQLKNLACGGETIGTFLDGGPRCSYAGSQMDNALAFLAAHPDTGLITVDIGGNDAQNCVAKATGAIDFVCLTNGMTAIGSRLPGLLAQLKTAAPNAQVILTNYPDVFLAAWLTGASGQNLAKLSVTLFDNLNAIFAEAATSAGVDFADVSEAFHTHDFTTMVTLPTYGEVPINVAKICTLTWMCTKQDIHGNDAGYAVIAEVISAMLREPVSPTPTTTPTPTPTTSPSPTVTATTTPAPTSTATATVAPTTSASPTPSTSPVTPVVVQTDGAGFVPENDVLALVLLGSTTLAAAVALARRRATARH